jgi:hypothetical protein
MVFGRKGRGGSQRAEVARMLDDEGARTAADRDWVRAERERLQRKEAALDAAVAALAGAAS